MPKRRTREYANTLYTFFGKYTHMCIYTICIYIVGKYAQDTHMGWGGYGE